MSYTYEVGELRNGGSADGALLLTLLSRGPQSWSELAEAGLSPGRVMTAISDLAGGFGYCVTIGPVRVWLAAGDQCC
jgi:hypothetical protein